MTRMTHTFTARGCAHMALAHLEAGPGTVAELRAAMGAQTRNRGRKAWHRLEAMREGLLIVPGSGRYQITALGRHALDVMRGGADFVSQGAGSAEQASRRAA